MLVKGDWSFITFLCECWSHKKNVYGAVDIATVVIMIY